ncbi:hypothetical protein AAG570_008087 [Ranatra chinensis]|uniref:Ubiquitin carboxyl-terminal hydrolase n=1 Tax=Ranatra chinensis TaxID=642074 RepID=A0ABD0XTT7_9HEMI
MHCVFFGCYGAHIQDHSMKNSHPLFVEMSNGFILCCSCNDYVYDFEFEEIANKQNFAQRNNGDPVCYVKWRPTALEDKLLKQHPKRIKVLNNSAAGMRGMFNLGNTCFMNCIMQALLHTPVLRDYFFTEKHKCYAQKKSDCLVCHFSRLFQKYYADDPFTLSLHEMLYLVWQNAHHLSGYDQNDAHEFFIAALNLLHQYSTPSNISKEPCTCIIDAIFHGKMQSDVVCLSCMNVSTTIDPIWDVSLDIPEPPTAVNLFECLHHYTRAEPLGSSAKIKCDVCQSYQESTKQLTFRSLPLVIVIHLKVLNNFSTLLFEGNYSGHKKKTIFVPFPLELDMSPFISGRRNRCSKNKNISCQACYNDDNRYALYAVIVHIGSLDTGHYVAYIRQAKQTWFRCADASVSPAELDEVMASEG